jgi:hypothetical protein
MSPGDRVEIVADGLTDQRAGSRSGGIAGAEHRSRCERIAFLSVPPLDTAFGKQ